MTKAILLTVASTIAAQSFAADTALPGASKQSFETVARQRFAFPPGGTIHIDRSFGYLNIDGWDEPEVDVEVTKSTDRFRNPDWKDHADRLFEQVLVNVERTSEKELKISTVLPHRTSLFTSQIPSGPTILTTPVPPNNKRGVTSEVTVRVPRNSNLEVHHDNGYVWVGGVTGDLDIHSRTGDMIVLLPDPGSSAIDASTKIGRISSDLPGKSCSHFVLNRHYVQPAEAAAHHVCLRMGRGSITIKTGTPDGPWWKN